MTLPEFQAWSLAQGTVGKFGTGEFAGECVSLVNQYLNRVLDIQAGAWGNAKDWATNATVAQYFDKVSSPQAGDIGVSGATATNPYGHIWIYNSPTTILEQNGKVLRRVSTSNAYFKPIAILRKKGTDMAKVDLNTARILAEEILGRDRDLTHTGKYDADLNANHVGQELDNAYIYRLWTSAESQNAAGQRASLAKQINDLKTALANEQAKPPKEIVKEVQVIVDRPVEVVKEVPVYTYDQETKNMITSIYNYFVGQFKTFQKYIKK